MTALVVGVAALCLKISKGRLSWELSLVNALEILFPIAVAIAVFIGWDVVKASKSLIKEVENAPLETRFNPYPSLLSPNAESFTETLSGTIPYYRIKRGYAAVLIIVLVGMCVGAWYASRLSAATAQNTAPLQNGVVSGSPESASPTPGRRPGPGPLVYSSPSPQAPPSHPSPSPPTSAIDTEKLISDGVKAMYEGVTSGERINGILSLGRMMKRGDDKTFFDISRIFMDRLHETIPLNLTQGEDAGTRPEVNKIMTVWGENNKARRHPDDKLINLIGLNFRRLYLKSANFDMFHFGNSDFSYAGFNGVSFRDSDFDGAIFTGATFYNCKKGNLKNRSLQDALKKYKVNCQSRGRVAALSGVVTPPSLWSGSYIQDSTFAEVGAMYLETDRGSRGC